MSISPRGLFIGLLLGLASARAAVVEVDLTVAETRVELAGRPVRALTLNGRLPGPTLRFREGDTARIRVRNALEDASTSLHWHGLLLPNPQDGVPYLTTPPIAPGATFTYEFPLRQTGTYWYHSHTGLQEQQGVFGAIVVSPREAPAVRSMMMATERMGGGGGGGGGSSYSTEAGILTFSGVVFVGATAEPIRVLPHSKNGNN